MAQSSGDKLAHLGRKIVRCVKCPLHEGRTHAVPGEGDPAAAIMMEDVSKLAI